MYEIRGVPRWRAELPASTDGELSGADREALHAQVRGLLDAGVRAVIDLRAAGEPPGIQVLLEKLARSDEAVAWVGLPILSGAPVWRDSGQPREQPFELQRLQSGLCRGRHLPARSLLQSSKYHLCRSMRRPAKRPPPLRPVRQRLRVRGHQPRVRQWRLCAPRADRVRRELRRSAKQLQPLWALR